MKLTDKYRVNLPHFDAAANVIFSNQLVQTIAGLFDTKYAEMKGKSFIPVDNSINPYMETVRWEQFTTHGPEAKALAGQDWQNDLPQVNGSGTENFQKMQSYGLAFGYNEQELGATALTGHPIDALRAMAVRKGLAQKLDDVCATGDSSRGLKGLLNQSNTTTDPGAAAAWDGTDTAEELVADLNKLVDAIFVGTKEVERPSRILLPTAYARLMQTTNSQTAGVGSAEKLFQAQNPTCQLFSWERLAGAGSAGADRIVAYDPNPLNLRLLLSVEFEAKPPQQRNMGFVVNCHMRTGGVIAPFPKSICYMDRS